MRSIERFIFDALVLLFRSIYARALLKKKVIFKSTGKRQNGLGNGLNLRLKMYTYHIIILFQVNIPVDDARSFFRKYLFANIDHIILYVFYYDFI